MSYTVAIVGRPNVGKSTLFNRLIGEKQAIIEDISGVTRDRQYGIGHWSGKDFNVVDTGGFVPYDEDIFVIAIRRQVEIAIQEASLILLMVDVTTGITDLDEKLADWLRKSPKKVLLVVNKVDNHQRQYDAAEFYRLGFEELFCISSISGSGTGELLDAITRDMPDQIIEETISDIPRIAIVGQPNVGKSSLLNALLGEERNIVTPIAGTTRDAINTPYRLYQKDLILIDTAGLRKKERVHENLEFYSVIRAIKAIDESDVCILLIDAQTGIEGQDLAILRLIEKKRKGIVIGVNKWDLVPDKAANTHLDYQKQLLERTAPFTDIPVMFISALEKVRIFQLLEKAVEVYQNCRVKISTQVLNEALKETQEKYPPPMVKGKDIKIKYVTQLPTPMPTLAFFCNHPKYIRQSYQQYLENQFRSRFSLSGVPLRLVFRES